jgi:hypothetical protein
MDIFSVIAQYGLIVEVLYLASSLKLFEPTSYVVLQPDSIHSLQIRDGS